jgi:hypothetical protein
MGGENCIYIIGWKVSGIENIRKNWHWMGNVKTNRERLNRVYVLPFRSRKLRSTAVGDSPH